MEKKRLNLIIVGIEVIFILGFFVYAYTVNIPNPGHGGDEVSVFISGQTKTLQQSIDDGSFESVVLGSPGFNCNIKYLDANQPTIICPSDYPELVGGGCTSFWGEAWREFLPSKSIESFHCNDASAGGGVYTAWAMCCKSITS